MCNFLCERVFVQDSKPGIASGHVLQIIYMYIRGADPAGFYLDPTFEMKNRIRLSKKKTGYGSEQFRPNELHLHFFLST